MIQDLMYEVTIDHEVYSLAGWFIDPRIMWSKILDDPPANKICRTAQEIDIRLSLY